MYGKSHCFSTSNIFEAIISYIEVVIDNLLDTLSSYKYQTTSNRQSSEPDSLREDRPGRGQEENKRKEQLHISLAKLETSELDKFR